MSAVSAADAGHPTVGRLGWQASPGAPGALLATAAFGLYWLSSIILESRGGTGHFGADAHLYTLLADGSAVDRITRFHPLTTALATAWMKLLAPLTPWVAPHLLLKGLFAAIGAAGVWAATAAFATVGPRRLAPALGAIYAASLGIWYFSSIEESKIVTTTLAAFYIATYLRLRTDWSPRGALLLTGLLLLACLNEIVAAFLVVIPAVDTLARKGWDLRQLRWIAGHALAAPAALLFLEGVVNGHVAAGGANPEGASHISMLVYYITRNEIDAGAVYTFAIRWLLFNIAAPALSATDGADDDIHYTGDFQPTLAGYLDSPISIGLTVLSVVILAAILLPRFRGVCPAGTGGLLLGLLGYAVLRGLFFFIINPGECLLFSSGVTLAHMLMVAIPFAASRLPAKGAVLAGFAALLFVTNATFIIGQ